MGNAWVLTLPKHFFLTLMLYEPQNSLTFYITSRYACFFSLRSSYSKTTLSKEKLLMQLVIEIGFPKIQNPMDLTQEHFNKIQKRADLVRLAQENEIPIEKALNKVKYEIELGKLQSEFVNLQKWIAQKKMRVAIIFEGRDAAGKGGSIKRFKEHLNPRNSRVVALQNLRILN